MMLLAQILAIVALGFSVTAAVSSRASARLQTLLGRAALGAAGLSFATLLISYLIPSVQYELVWTYTHSDLPFWYRLAGAWTSREGSLLLWALYATLFAHVSGRDQSLRGKRTSLMLHIQSALLLAFVIRENLARPTADFLLDARPRGNGLNPSLQNPFMLIHPPIVFAAYAMTAWPAAHALSSWWCKDTDWAAPMLRVVRTNWLLYTIAMSLGGLWAYETLGFGGYWAWDPVEVANLLPWLGLTLALHMLRRGEARGHFPEIGRILLVVPLLLTYVSTLSTRSGLWVSVHAFTDPTNAFEPDAARRFLNILNSDPSLVAYLHLMGIALVAMLLFWHASGPRRAGHKVRAALLALAGSFAILEPEAMLAMAFQLSERTPLGAGATLGLVLLIPVAIAGYPHLFSPSNPRTRRDTRWMLEIAGILLGLSLVVVFMFHMSAVNGWTTAFWTTRLPWLTLPLTAGLMFQGFRSRLGNRRASLVTALILLIGLLLAALGPNWHLALTTAFGALFAGAFRLWHDLPNRRAVAPLLAGLLGILFWSDAPDQFLIAIPGWLAAPGLAASIVVGYFGLRSAFGEPIPAFAKWLHILAFGFGASILLLLAAPKESGSTRGPTFQARAKILAAHGIHLTIAIFAIGYVLSTYLVVITDVEADVGEPVIVGGNELVFEGLSGPAADLRANFDGPVGVQSARWWYEPRTEFYVPEPSIASAWWGHSYIFVDTICQSSTCDETLAVRTAFVPEVQWPDGAEAQHISYQIRTLPGMRLVYGGVVATLAFAALLVRPTQDE